MKHTYVPCSGCGRLNRVDLEQSARKEPICGGCQTPLPLHLGVIEGTDRSLQTLAGKSPLPVLCDLWASWCGPCKAFAPVFQQAAMQFGGRAVFLKVNTEKFPQASAAFGVRSIPTILLFADGKEKDRLSGALPLDAFASWLEERL